MIGGIGMLEILLVLFVALVVLGPKKMVESARTAGRLVRELRDQREQLTGMLLRELDLDDDRGPSRRDPPPPAGAVARPSASSQAPPADDAAAGSAAEASAEAAPR
jgi:Sec-independent protein translocase protein TatA